VHAPTPSGKFEDLPKALRVAWGSRDTLAKAHATAARGSFPTSCPARSAETWGPSASHMGGAEVGYRDSILLPTDACQRLPRNPWRTHKLGMWIAVHRGRLPYIVDAVVDQEHAYETRPPLPWPRLPHDL